MAFFLHLGAEHTVLTVGDEPATAITLALGYEKTTREFFRTPLPTPLELEIAIATVEDEIHAAHRRHPGWLPEGHHLTPRSADAGLHEIATFAGVPPGPERLLTLDAMERLFNRLAAVSEGRPAAHEGLPYSAAFAARLLVLRELMHHVPLAAVTLVDAFGETEAL